MGSRTYLYLFYKNQFFNMQFVFLLFLVLIERGEGAGGIYTAYKKTEIKELIKTIFVCKEKSTKRK